MTTVSAYFVSVEHLSGNDFTTMPELRDILFCLCFAAVVALWSWASGFVLAALFGRTIWLTVSAAGKEGAISADQNSPSRHKVAGDENVASVA